MMLDDLIPQKPVEETAKDGYSMLGHRIFLAGRRRIPASLAFSVIAIAAGAFTMFSWNTSQLKFASTQNSVITPSTSKAKESKKEDKDSAILTKTAKPSSDQILIKFRGKIDRTQQVEIIQKHNLKEKKEIEKIGVRVMKVPSDKSPQDVVHSINAEDLDTIEFAEVDMIVPPSLIPNDPDYGSQWHHPVISSPLAWDTSNGSGVTIAIGDTGVDCTAPDLATACVTGWNVINNNSTDTNDIMGHGTATAGTAAAIGNNANQIAGVAFGAKIMPIRVTNDPAGNAYYSDLASAITYAADHGARIVSESYETTNSASVQSAANYLISKGGLFVSSAGNASANLTYGNPDSVITVSATDNADNKASWSNYGIPIDIAAPGVSILTTANGGEIRYASGTSFSSPATAGVIALILSTKPSLKPVEARQILFESADDLGTSGRDDLYGWGRINSAKAVEMAKNFVSTTDTTAPTAPTNLVASAISSTQVNLSWNASQDNVGVTGYQIFRDGTKIGTSTSVSYSDKTVSSGITYAYTVRAYDAENNISLVSNTASITTPVQTLTITSNSVTKKTGTSVVINWATNQLATGIIRYGTSSGNLTLSMPTSKLATSQSVTLSNLSAKTTYYYKIEATNETGSTVSSAVSSFVTKPR